MKRVAVFMCLYLVNSCNAQDELFEGSDCMVDELMGVCKDIRRCQYALEILREEKYPEICAFSGTTPIVCCIERNYVKSLELNMTLEVTSSTSPAPPTTAAAAVTADTTDSGFLSIGLGLDQDGEVNVSTRVVQCPPISPEKTASKTGRKAWDKCLEYQEQLIYPCDTSNGTRFNYCQKELNLWILGGQDAYEGEFPHMALVGYGPDPSDLEFLCGGSLISDRFVLTAGHCTSAKTVLSHVLLGILKRSSYNQSNLHKVQSVYKHPNYLPPRKYNDIALLRLETPVTLTWLTIPACLDTGDVSEEEVATATGWGTVEYRGSGADILQKVDLTSFTEAECMARYMPTRLMTKGYDSKSQLCYGDRKTSKDTCQGDSGGPLQVRHKMISCMYTVIGITSFGRACGLVGEPALYTRVANYVPWIEAIVWPDP